MVAKKYQDELKNLKKLVEASCDYFKANNQRFHNFQRFTFQSALGAADVSTLEALQKPVIEFNIVNAPVDRLCGEFSKQQPSIYVSAEEGSKLDPQMLEALEGHVRHIIYNLNKDNTQYGVYRDQLSGGFSMYKCYTDYKNEMSFEQELIVERIFEPTLCGFDPMARKVTKKDAEYYWEIFPMTEEEFMMNFPDQDTNDMKFIKLENQSIAWSYTDTKNKRFVIVCDIYRKKRTQIILYKLADGRTVTKEQYADMIQKWDSFAQPPAIVTQRKSMTTTICRYRFNETTVLEYEETPYRNNNIVFVDGNSVTIKDQDSGSFRQFTKPYVYHSKGLQQLTNLAGQMIGNDFENMVQHKFMVAKEAIPQEPEYQEALKNPQVAQVMVYNAFVDNDPEKGPLPPIQPVDRVPLPSEVTNVFNNCMQMLQNILGSYDAQLGIQQKDLSGIAITEGATQSNAAAMPYVVNYMHALNDVAQWCLDMIPKIWKTPRTIPIVTKEGKSAFVQINSPGGPQIKYDPCDLNIRIEAGVSFAVAKNRAIQQVTALMNVSQEFSAFMNSVGLPFLLDNLEFRGVDVLKDMATKWMQQQQQNQQPDPQTIAAQAAAQTAQARVMDAQTKAAIAQSEIQQASYNTIINAKQAETAQQQADTARITALASIGESHGKLLIDASKVQAEENRTKVQTAQVVHDMHLKDKEQEHNHLKDIIEIANNRAQQDTENDLAERGLQNAQSTE
jgi:hypothetical protein